MTTAWERFGDVLMDPDATEQERDAARAELDASTASTCTWVRADDGAACVLKCAFHAYHLTADGDEFPPRPRTLEGRPMHVA